MGGVRSSSPSQYNPDCDQEYEEHSGDQEPLPYRDETEPEVDDVEQPSSYEKYPEDDEAPSGETGQYGRPDRKNKYYYRPRNRHRPNKSSKQLCHLTDRKKVNKDIACDK